MESFEKLVKGIEKESAKKTKERDARCIGLGREIIQILAEVDVDLTVEEFGEQMKAYKPVYEKIIEYATDNNIKVSDIDYAFKFVLRAVGAAKEITTASLDMNVDKAIEKVIGKKYNDLSIKDVDNLLKV